MTESLEIIPYLASPEVGEVSRSDGEVNSHSISRPFEHERVVICCPGIGFDDEINDVMQSFCRRGTVNA